MCGIAGIIDPRGRENSKLTVEAMLRAISYRGPDESGIYHSRLVTIGNVRLSILDISGGSQPMTDISGRYWIVFNGEIFNYKELRLDLEKQGHRFKTQSDTEVLIQLYSHYGRKCLELLNGQFAFAIWDKSEEELFIARDRVGIRPLFYNITDGVLSFASEIKALFMQKKVSRELDAASLKQVYTFWTTITPNTPFKNIQELSPGHYLTFKNTKITIGKYWTLNFSPSENKVTIGDATEQFNDLFRSAVKLRLRSDVEVAAYLSGGIDSSATVAYIKDIEPGILNTFSIGFEDKNFDESRFQNEAVKYFSTNHRYYKCTSKEIALSFPNVVRHSEMPLTRTAPAPMFLLSKLVKENNIKVVVTGEGADELLAGYDIFKELQIRQFWATQPESKIRPLLLKKLYPYIPHIAHSGSAALKMFFGYKLEDINNPYYSHLLRWNNSNHIKKHFSDNFRDAGTSRDLFSDLDERLPESFSDWDPLARAQWLETTIFMSGYLLSSQGDRMAMANSVEGRYPFLDYRLIEFCISLPPELILKGLTEKYLLKKLLKGKIPDSIINRTKQPYRAPVKDVFLSGEAPEYVNEMLSETFTKRAGIFNHTSLQSVLERVQKTGATSEMDDMLITSVISTHLLYHQFIENNNNEFQTVELNNLRIIEDMPLV